MAHIAELGVELLKLSKDPESFEPFWNLLVRIAKRWRRTLEDAEDVAAEVIAKLQASHELRAQRLSIAYVSTMVRNAAIDHLRRERRRKDAVSLSELHEPLPSRAEEIADSQTAAQILCSSLNEHDLQLLELRFCEQLTLKEMADRLGISPSAAAKRWIRLRDRLRDESAQR